MIPKILHYCWFGKSTITDDMQKYLKSWRVHCPDYKIKKWDESNSPLDVPYLASAMMHKKWSNMSNFIRLYSVYHEGGIYLDTDMEIIKNIDIFLDNKCFFGWQLPSRIEEGVNSAFFGAQKKCEFVRELMEELSVNFDGKEESALSGPFLVSKLLIKKGLSEYKDYIHKIGDITLYPKRYFYPFSAPCWLKSGEVSGDEKIQNDTYCIHYWKQRWS